MQIIRTLTEWRQVRSSLGAASLGFVPTMGCLHPGHRQLLERAASENDFSVMSLFVNPAQFNDPADFKLYPRDEAKDLALAEAAGIDCVWLPTEAELYPDGYAFRVTSLHPLAQCMEGIQRPLHFDGVLTVVMKLLLLVRAQRAYFGEKDYQQLQLVTECSKAFFLETDIVPCETVRLPSGLPYSSRNSRLDAEGMGRAEAFARILEQHKTLADVKRELTALSIPYDYVEEADGRILAAVRIGGIRLLDNR